MDAEISDQIRAVGLVCVRADRETDEDLMRLSVYTVASDCSGAREINSEDEC